jgi:hypothetical protein
MLGAKLRYFQDPITKRKGFIVNAFYLISQDKCVAAFLLP